VGLLLIIPSWVLVVLEGRNLAPRRSILRVLGLGGAPSGLVVGKTLFFAHFP